MVVRDTVLRGLQILVVDDNRDALDIFRLVLTYFGATVTTARSARAALRTLKQIRVAVVIADMRLGRSDARWLLQQARAENVTAPFIAVSGDDFDFAALRREGFAGFLRKPIGHGELLDAVRTVVGR